MAGTRKKLLRNLLFLITEACAVFGSRADAAVQWYSSIEEASVLAVQTNRPLLIDFWANWCAPCKAMEKDVYSTAEFERAAGGFLPVKIDYDRKISVARRYHVEALPTTVFADSYGNQLFQYHGYLDARSLLELIKALPADVTEFNRLNKILAAEKNDQEALEGMGNSLRAAGLFRASNEYYARVLQRPQAKVNAEKRQMLLNAIGLNFLEVKDGMRAAEFFGSCLKEFPNNPRRTEWTLNLGRAYTLGDIKAKDKAKIILNELVRKQPLSSEAELARRILKLL